MATANPRFVVLICAAAVIASGVAGDLLQPQTIAASGSDATTPPPTASSNPTPATPKSPPAQVQLNVPESTLDNAVIRADMKELQARMEQHKGDGISRGPDDLVYNIDVRIDPSSHQFAGHLDLHFRNNLDSDLSTLYFNVWPNAVHYTRKGGSENVTHVQEGDAAATSSMKGTVLTVQLPNPVRKGENGEVSFDFAANLPNINDRYGYQDTTVNMGNWYPILAVHDDHGWVTPPYYPDGESFYSLTGAYHLHVTVPSNVVVAATGDETGHAENGDGTKTYTYAALGVRDTAIVADEHYKVMTGKVGNTTVYTYYRPDETNQQDQAQLMTDVAEQSIAAYNQQYGAYPYKVLRVCAMQGWFGGMEYPQLVMISFPAGQPNTESTTATDVAHEVAHQWFYGMVGDDEYLTPFIDESFATFSEMRLHGTLDRYAGAVFPDHPTYSVSAYSNSDYPNASVGNHSYGAAVYLGGAQAIEKLRQKLGDARFNRAMKAYFAEYQYQVATPADFIKAMSAAAGEDLSSYMTDELHIDPEDATNSPVNQWVHIEEQQNGRSWAAP